MRHIVIPPIYNDGVTIYRYLSVVKSAPARRPGARLPADVQLDPVSGVSCPTGAAARGGGSVVLPGAAAARAKPIRQLLGDAADLGSDLRQVLAGVAEDRAESFGVELHCLAGFLADIGLLVAP